jgi:hypothetical protein
MPAFSTICVYSYRRIKCRQYTDGTNRNSRSSSILCTYIQLALRNPVWDRRVFWRVHEYPLNLPSWSVCMYFTTRLPLNESSLSLILASFITSCRHASLLMQMGQFQRNSLRTCWSAADLEHRFQSRKKHIERPMHDSCKPNGFRENHRKVLLNTISNLYINWAVNSGINRTNRTVNIFTGIDPLGLPKED